MSIETSVEIDMNGGMMRAAGPGAVAALAALLLSPGSVLAADLGGNCCADLEERVAELEATTVRKGNRKVSLTLYGWVHKGIMYWNDGEQSNTYFGVDNINFATRFGLRGDAKITPEYTAGFSILMDIISGATSSGVRRDREDRSVDNFDQFQNVTSSPANAWSEDVIIRMRDANVWVESKRLGRFTVGHLTNVGPQGIVDLGGTAVASVAAIDLVGGSFQFRNSTTGAVTAATISNNTTNVADFSHRTDSVRWDSPTHYGFVLSAAYGEAGWAERSNTANNFLNPVTMAGPVGPYWSVALRYAGEHHGFRVAAAAAYERSNAEERAFSSSALGRIDDFAANTGYSASALHIASGLFLQASWIRFDRPNLVLANNAALTPQGGGQDSGTLWQIQGGIAQNWTGMGKTVLFAEYARGYDLQRTFSPVTNTFTATQTQANVAAAVIPATNLDNAYTMWGLGVVQNIDAAAMEVYVNYRRNSLDHDAVTGVDVQDIHIVFGGARIAF
jgi:hypothetical protein